MPFGYSPQKNCIMDLLLRIFGWPNWMRRLQGPIMLEYLNLESSDRVLDIGCGSGPFTFECARRGCFTVGLDIRNVPNAYEIMDRNDHIFYVIADGSRMPFRNEVFDKMIISSVIQMVFDPTLLLRGVWRVLKKRGIFALSSPAEHVLIPRLYEGLEEGLSALGYPSSSDDMLESLAVTFGARGRGLFSENEARSLVAGSGLELESISWVPGKIASSFYEFILLLSWRLGMPLSSAIHFPFLFPLGWIEGKLGESRGNEMIIIGSR